MSLWVICTSSLEISLFRFSAHLKNQVVWFCDGLQPVMAIASEQRLLVRWEECMILPTVAVVVNGRGFVLNN